uniref:DExD/H box RNA helicase 45 n=1 Tax=Philasterides dicentrarchi TaxID=282688 RepID=A0A481XSJ5_9CILI|nr:DExD/H box RNA helicase 45 [Philasterides dicentrarchi]
MAEHLLLKFKKKEKVKTSSGQELTQQDKQINSQISIYNLSTIPKGQNPNIMPSKHYILVGTPSQFLKFAQTMQIDKKYYVNFAVDDLDYMLSFGYEQDLDNFQFHFQHQIATSQLLITISSEFTKELQNILEKITLRGRQIDLNLAQELEEAAQDEQLKKTQQAFEREYRLVSQFYHLGDETSKYIILYILYKLHFLVGKTLIVCPDNDQVYKVFLFLQRINVKGFQVLNEEDPKDLRYYVLSMFNTGVVQNLITTEKVFDDLKSKTFYHKKRKVLSFKNLNNIINMDLSHVEKIYNNMYTHFKGSEGTIINLLSTDEQEIDVLTKLIEEQKQTQSQINIKEFPLKKNEIDAFKYRISDVIGAISRKQISNMRMLDFKRKMLKSSDLVQYFQQNESEKLMLVEHIQTLSQQIHRYGIKCEEDIPDYLVPDMVKEQRKKMGDVTNQKYQKLQVTTTNENFQQSLKRRMEGQGKSLDDIKKKRVIEKMDNDNFVYVNNKKENIEGDQVDPSQLKIISGRKLWKQRHGFKTKKRNRRLERKGIYNA